jgi:uncharacterized membrane protein
MAQQTQQKQLITIGIIAAYATLAFIGTTIIRIPIPATGGYFNLGDTFVMAAALLHGPLVGGAVGLIGPAMADAIGFPQFILATAVVKGIEGILVGGIGLAKGGRRSGLGTATALIVGIIILTGGYYIFEAMIYPALAKSVPFYGVTDAKAALAEIGPNLLQGVLSAVIAFGIWRVFVGVKK